jgi:hypothetical protein
MASEFINHMKGKYPELDIDTIVKLVNQNVNSIQTHTKNPNKQISVPLGCDMNKNLIIKTISEYLKKD